MGIVIIGVIIVALIVLVRGWFGNGDSDSDRSWSGRDDGPGFFNGFWGASSSGDATGTSSANVGDPAQGDCGPSSSPADGGGGGSPCDSGGASGCGSSSSDSGGGSPGCGSSSS